MLLQKIVPRKKNFRWRRLFEISRIVVPSFNLLGLCQDFHILGCAIQGRVRQYGDNMVMQTTEEVKIFRFDQYIEYIWGFYWENILNTGIIWSCKIQKKDEKVGILIFDWNSGNFVRTRTCHTLLYAENTKVGNWCEPYHLEEPPVPPPSPIWWTPAGASAKALTS